MTLGSAARRRHLETTDLALVPYAEAIATAMAVPGITASEITITPAGGAAGTTVLDVTVDLRSSAVAAEASTGVAITPAAITAAVTAPTFTSSLAADPVLAATGVTVLDVGAPTVVAEVIAGPSPPPPSPPPSPPPPTPPVLLYDSSRVTVVTTDLNSGSSDVGMVAGFAIITICAIFMLICIPVGAVGLYCFLRKSRGGERVTFNNKDTNPIWSAPASAPAAFAMQPGAAVMLTGLAAKPELNGAEGVLGSFDEAVGRWQVKLTAGGSVKVKPVNIEPLAESGLASGASPDCGAGVGTRSSPPTRALAKLDADFDVAAEAGQPVRPQPPSPNRRPAAQMSGARLDPRIFNVKTNAPPPPVARQY